MFCAACGEETAPTLRLCPACGAKAFVAERPGAAAETPAAPAVVEPAPTSTRVVSVRPRRPGLSPAVVALLAIGGGVALVGVLAFLGMLAFWASGPAAGRPGIAFDESDPFHLIVATTMTFGHTESVWPFADVALTASVDGAETKQWSVVADENGTVSFDLHDLWLDAGSPERMALRASTSWKDTPLHAEKSLSRAEIDAAIATLVAGSPSAEDLRNAVLWNPDDRSLWRRLAEASADAGEKVDALFAWREWLMLPDDGETSKREIREKAVALAASLEKKPGGTADAIALLEEAKSRLEEGNEDEAYDLAVAAENAAPWWTEPYLRAGAITLVQWNRSADESEAGDPDEVVSWDLEQAVALGSEEASSLLERARSRRAQLVEQHAAEQELESAYAALERKMKDASPQE